MRPGNETSKRSTRRSSESWSVSDWRLGEHMGDTRGRNQAQLSDGAMGRLRARADNSAGDVGPGSVRVEMHVETCLFEDDVRMLRKE